MCGKYLPKKLLRCWRLVRPYLVVKGEQADVLLELQDRIERRGKSQAKTSPKKSRHRVALRARITDLNKRGAG